MTAFEPVCGRPELPSWTCQGQCSAGQCLCAEGWQHDGAMYHLANCAEPKVFIPIIGSLSLAWCALMQYSILRRRRVLCKRRANPTNGNGGGGGGNGGRWSNMMSPARVVMLGAQVSVVGLALASVALLAFGYCTATWFFFATVAAQAISVSLTTTVVSYARIVYASLAASFPERTYRVVYVCSVVLLGSPFWFLALPGAAYFDTNPELANTLIAVSICLVPMQLIVTGPVLFSASRQLLKEMHYNQANSAKRVDGSSSAAGSGSAPGDSAPGQQLHSTKMQRTLRRIKMFQVANGVVIVFEVAFCVGAGLMYLLARVPYNWILLTLLMVTLHVTPHVFIVTTADGTSVVNSSVVIEGGQGGGEANRSNNRSKGDSMGTAAVGSVVTQVQDASLRVTSLRGGRKGSKADSKEDSGAGGGGVVVVAAVPQGGSGD